MNFEALLADQGLAVALAVSLVGCLIWLARKQMVTIEQYIKHNTQVLSSLKTSVDAQTDAAKEFTLYVQERDKNGGKSG